MKPISIVSAWNHSRLRLVVLCILVVFVGVHVAASEQDTDDQLMARAGDFDAMKELFGLTGKTHAFRALQKVYGVETVGLGSWISGNSRYKYPENIIDDGLGCDFVISENGKAHYVEVKATQAEDEAFELGSSEVKLAVDLANGRLKKFVILHVLNALSDEPIIRFLPNPYDKKQKNKYRFEEAGLRVRYEVS